MRTRVTLPLTAGAILLTVAALRAQSPQFEVASVKANRTESGGSSWSSYNGKVATIDVSLLSLLEYAYDLSAPRIVGPGWLDSDRYDVMAKSPEGVPDSKMPEMLQTLLKDRFRMTVHWDKKEMPVYQMVVAKDGLKMPRFDPAHPDLTFKPGGGVISTMGVGTMPELAKTISRSAGRPVIDGTGVEGLYIYQLSFAPLSAQSETASDPAPDFFAAIQQQLGLKLEPKKAPVDILVIDHADRVPSEN